MKTYQSNKNISIIDIKQNFDLDLFINLKEKVAEYKTQLKLASEFFIKYDIDFEKEFVTLFNKYISKESTKINFQIEREEINNELLDFTFDLKNKLLQNLLDEHKHNLLNNLSSIEKYKFLLDKDNFDLSIKFIQKWHKQIFKKDLKKFPGQISKFENYVDTSFNDEEIRVNFIYPENKEKYLNDLFTLLKFNTIDSFIKAIILHLQLAIIHPFIDGNGRFIRVLSTKLIYKELNLLLPIDEVLYSSKKEYILALNKYNIENDIYYSINFFLQKYIEQANKNIRKIEAFKLRAKALDMYFYEMNIKDEYKSYIYKYFLFNKVFTLNNISQFIDKRTAEQIVNKFIKNNLIKKHVFKNKTNREKVYILNF